MTEAKKPVLYIAALAIASSALLGQAFSSRFNSLEKNGRWTSTKSHVEYLNGAAHYFSGSQSLNRYRLDLGAWNGFQEVVSKDAISPKQIDFEFYLPRPSYFYAIFNKDEGGFSGIRISTSDVYDNCYFDAEDGGRFLRRTPFQNDHLQPDSWNSCRLSFSSAAVAVSLNGLPVRSFPMDPKKEQRIGFRGSSGNVLIDDIRITTADGTVVRESFFNVSLFLSFFFTGLLTIAAAQAAFGLFLKARNVPSAEVLKKLLLLNVRVLIVSILTCGFVPLWSARYPSTTGFLRGLQRKEEAFLKAAPRLISDIIMEKYGFEKTEGLYRICFFGTSQTGGAGAKSPDDTSVRRLENLLNRSSRESVTVECINPSVGGGDTTRMLPYFQNDWINLKPNLVVAILSTNDTKDVFGPNLQQIVLIGRKHGASTVFVLEANSPEFPYEIFMAEKHAIMRRVGRENNIPVLDAHEYLKARRNDGILWWDIVHLTSFGHELMANFLYENLKPMIDEQIKRT